MNITYEVTDQQSNQYEPTCVITHHWAPIKDVAKSIAIHCETNKYELVLEIGPGQVPFEKATNFIGCNESVTNYVEVDIDKEPLPFPNNHFDFVYCRHVLEDIQNPDFAMNEIIRVSRYGGFVETPSPLIEATKNVDASDYTHLYCGYIHHRYLVWSSIEKNEIYFLPKYSCILDHIVDIHNPTIYKLINNCPIYWNNYFVFNSGESDTPKIIVYKNGVHFNIKGNNQQMIQEYTELVVRAINESIQNTNYFFEKYVNGQLPQQSPSP
jgi:SAM-dependent methyltransferase